jgi:hypothetical protein
LSRFPRLTKRENDLKSFTIRQKILINSKKGK